MEQGRVLAINAMLDGPGQRAFAEGIEGAVEALARPGAAGTARGAASPQGAADAGPVLRVVPVAEAGAIAGEVAAGAFSHLIISGSEASITEEWDWEGDLRRVLDTALGRDVPVLGICYGAQFIAKHLAGPDTVGKLPTAEFGYVRIPLPGDAAERQAPAAAAGPGAEGVHGNGGARGARHAVTRARDLGLLAGIHDPVAVQMHYDFIRRAPAGFQVLSRNDRGIQAMVHETAPVVAYQFHPEFSHTFAEKVFRRLSGQEPRWQEIYRNELRDPEELAQNRRFLTNFLGIRQGVAVG